MLKWLKKHKWGAAALLGISTLTLVAVAATGIDELIMTSGSILYKNANTDQCVYWDQDNDGIGNALDPRVCLNSTGLTLYTGFGGSGIAIDAGLSGEATEEDEIYCDYIGCTFTGTSTFTEAFNAQAGGVYGASIAVDTINENTVDVGVTIDGLLIKDGAIGAGGIDSTTALDGALCGTNEILEDQGASWACIATPSGAFPGFTDIDTDYGDETVLSTWTFTDVGTGAFGSYDLRVGDVTTPDYGGIQIGGNAIYSSSFSTGNLNLDKSLVFRNEQAVSGILEFAWIEQGNTIRAGIPESAAGNATNFIRSFMVAGPYSAATGDNHFICDTHTSYDPNIDCNTSTTGADMFVQDDFELEGEIFVSGGTIRLDSDDANQLTISATSQTASHTFDFPDDEIADDDVVLGDGAGSFTYAAVPNCLNGFFLTYDDSTNTFGCAAVTGYSWDLTDTDSTPVLTVDDTEQVQFIGAGTVSISAAADGSNHDVTITGSAHTTDTNANTICAGTNVYLDGEGNCDTISGGGVDVKSGVVSVTEGGSGGDVTFATAFSGTPYCTCTVVNVSGDEVCWFDATPSSTAISIDFDNQAGGGAATSDVNWICTDAGDP